jgi:hypothetical protein
MGLVEGTDEGVIDELTVLEVIIDEGDVEDNVEQDVQVAA